MKILVVTQYFWPENFRINDLCDALIERGHDVTVYTGLPNYPEGEFAKGYSFFGPYREKKNKIKIIRSPLIPRGKNKSMRLALNYFSFFFFASLLAPFLVRGKYDKIFVYEPSPITVAIPGIVLRFLKKAPMFFWVTDLWPESLEATGVVKNKKILNAVSVLVKWLYRYSDRILVTSKGFIPRVNALEANKEKVVYWPQWAEAFYADVVTDYSDTRLPNGFIIMFAGNIGTSQDFESLVNAALILKDHKDIHFVILGDGLMKSWAQNFIQEHNLSANFHFLGRKPVESMPYYYSKADVMLMSLTNTDLFSITVPSKLQSYLASRKPVLAAMNGEGAQIVRDANAGFTCSAGNPEELAKTILKFKSCTKEEMELMASNALKCYRDQFEREMLVDQLEDLFHKVQYE